MLSKDHRFHGHNSLRPIYQHGRIVRGQLMIVRVRPTDRPGGYRAAIVVSRKVHKSAVVRNRIRRRVYAILQKYESDFKPHDIILTAVSERLADMPATGLETLVRQQLQKAGVLARNTSGHSHGIVDKKEI